MVRLSGLSQSRLQCQKFWGWAPHSLTAAATDVNRPADRNDADDVLFLSTDSQTPPAVIRFVCSWCNLRIANVLSCTSLINPCRRCSFLLIYKIVKIAQWLVSWRDVKRCADRWLWKPCKVLLLSVVQTSVTLFRSLGEHVQCSCPTFNSSVVT